MRLEELHLPPDVLAQVKKLLAEAQDSLHQSRPGQLDSAVFGDSWWGGALGGNTAIAHEHVVQAIHDMVTGLAGYEENVGRFEARFRHADEDARTDLDKINGDIACTAPTDVHSNPSCTG